MALGFKSAGAKGRGVGFVPPISVGCVGWFDLGAAETKNTRFRNKIDKVPTEIVGAPVQQVGYTTFIDGVNSLRVPQPDTPSMTILVLARAPLLNPVGSLARARFLANYRSGVSGIDFGMSKGSVRLYWNGNATPFALASTGYAAWGLYACVIEAGVGRALYNLTAGTVAQDAATDARLITANDRLRIGGRGPTGDDYEGVDDNAVAWWNRALSKEEIDIAASFMRERAAAKGIVA